jgi:prepilin-type N-terminal cleavage/methylation domain-containing protein
MQIYPDPSASWQQHGMTLTEVVVSLGIGGLIFGGVLTGYLQSAGQAEWSAYNLAGHSLAMQRLEAARASKWDTQASPSVDKLVASNFPVNIEVLDVPLAGTNVVEATNTVFITTISADPPLKMIRVETVWAFRQRGLFTNVTATYRGPDQ